MGRVMGIDYGRARIGLAVTDPLRIICTPLTTVTPKELLPFLSNYLKEEQIDCFVVGEPLGLDGEPTDATAGAKKLATQLKKAFPAIPVEWEDERYTSKDAMAGMIAMGIPQKKRRDKANTDKVSASIILQAWLDKQMPS